MSLTKASYSMINGAPINVRDYGADPTGSADSTAAIQAAINAAAAAGNKVVGTGTFKTSSQITIKCNADFSSATFNVYGAPAVAIEISTGSAANPLDYLADAIIWLPQELNNMTKPTTGWAGQGVGVRTVNIISCQIFVGTVLNFATGLLATAYSQGNVYNTYYLGHLSNNKVNLQLTIGNSGGATNENLFIGGRYSHFSAEGTNISGCRHILISKASSGINNSVFLKPSIEGDGPEYQVENGGAYNQFISARWESSPPKVLYTADNANQAVNNQIIGGYNTQSIVYTFTGSSGGLTGNHTLAGPVEYHSTSSGALSQNYSSSGSPIHAFYDVTTHPETAGATEWTMQHSSAFLQGKTKAQTYATVKLDYQNGYIFLGDGSAAPGVGFRQGTANQIRVTATGSFASEGDNATSLGTSGNRWSVVYAGTGAINTSDANQKQDVSTLDAAEKATATAIKDLMKKFKFKSAVAEKGASARYHFGVIAQEVQAAFAANGLDATHYGVFCSDKLEDGSYRLGIRYDELLCFVIGAM